MGAPLCVTFVTRARNWGSELAALSALFNVHVFEFAGLEDLAALHAFDEFSFFVTADDLHTWVFARLLLG